MSTPRVAVEAPAPAPLPAWDLGALREAPERAPAPEPTPDADATAEQLCASGRQDWLVVRRGGAQRMALRGERAIATLSGGVSVASGRHRGQPALALTTLLEPGVRAVRVSSCAEPPRTFTVGELEALAPVLVTNQRGQLKLLTADAATRAVRRVAMVELL